MAKAKAKEKTPKIKLGTPVKQLVKDFFHADKSKEHSTEDVVGALQKKYPTINPASVRYMMTELKQEGWLRRVRSNGRMAVLIASEPSSTHQPVSTDDSPFLSAPGAFMDDLRVITEAQAMLEKLGEVVKRTKERMDKVAKMNSQIKDLFQ